MERDNNLQLNIFLRGVKIILTSLRGDYSGINDIYYTSVALEQIADLLFIDEEKITYLIANDTSTTVTDSTDTTLTESDPKQKNKDLISLLRSVFSSPYSLSKSFLKNNNSPMDLSVATEAPDSANNNAKHKLTPEIAVDIISVARVSLLVSN